MIPEIPRIAEVNVTVRRRTEAEEADEEDLVLALERLDFLKTVAAFKNMVRADFAGSTLMSIQVSICQIQVNWQRQQEEKRFPALKKAPATMVIQFFKCFFRTISPIDILIVILDI